MRPSFWHRLDSLARRLTPFGLTLILMLLSLTPLHAPEVARVVPALSMIAVYHWAINRPELLPGWVVFVIGFLQDSLSGTALGLNILLLLTVYGIVIYQRRFLTGKSFLVVWSGFALVAGLAFAEGWLLMSILAFTFLDAAAIAAQYAITVGIFPLIAWCFIRWQQAFLALEEA